LPKAVKVRACSMGWRKTWERTFSGLLALLVVA
jgi:hypothetical protein